MPVATRSYGDGMQPDAAAVRIQAAARGRQGRQAAARKGYPARREDASAED